MKCSGNRQRGFRTRYGFELLNKSDRAGERTASSRPVKLTVAFGNRFLLVENLFVKRCSRVSSERLASLASSHQYDTQNLKLTS